MSPEFIAIVVVGLSNAAALGFLWTLSRDVGDLRERMAKLEGSVDVLTRFLVDRERAAGRGAAAGSP